MTERWVLGSGSRGSAVGALDALVVATALRGATRLELQAAGAR
jgi:hypothetical protein